jgi:ribulose-bisphosphate carboxylase large chain
MSSSCSLTLSGELLKAVYHLSGDAGEVSLKARNICVEQTVEFPEDLICRQDIKEQIIGRVLSIKSLGQDLGEAIIGYPAEVAGGELTQLLNVLFGNISIQPGIRLISFELPKSLSAKFKGPRFGRHGIRELLRAEERPLLCTAVKPMGLSPRELADLAYKFALGGMDIIKDDHGLANQVFCGFYERVRRVGEAVAKAREKTGEPCLYFPNITGPFDEMERRATAALDAGAGGFVMSPGLVGFDTMRRIADDDCLALPILSHPAMLGSYTVDVRQGISHGTLYGQINRLTGADACIFPSFGGRFSFTEDECREIADATKSDMGEIAPIFPVPAGGMNLDRIPELKRFYGNGMILLIGGDLHRHGPDLSENCKVFKQMACGGD